MSKKQHPLISQSHIKQCGHKAKKMFSIKCSVPSEDKHAECNQHEDEEELTSPGERVT